MWHDHRRQGKGGVGQFFHGGLLVVISVGSIQWAMDKNLLQKSPGVGAAGVGSFDGHRLHAPDTLKSFKPRTRSWLEAKTARTAGQRVGSAAQNAQALLIEAEGEQGRQGWFSESVFKHVQIV